MVVSRASTVLWALVLFAVAVYAVHTGGTGNVVEIGLSIASVAYGCLLGVFLLGTLTRTATQGGAIVGMITGFALNVALWLQPATRIAGVTVPKVAWTWYVIIGALVTFAVGSLASVVFRSTHRADALRNRRAPSFRHPERSVAPLRRAVAGACPAPRPATSRQPLSPLEPPPPTSPPSPPPSTQLSRRRSCRARSSSSATAARSSSTRPTACASWPANPASTANPPQPSQ